VEDFPWREKRGGTPIFSRYAYWAQRVLAGFLIKFFSDEVLAVSDQTKEKLLKIKGISSRKVKAVYAGVEYERISAIGKNFPQEKETKYDAVFMKRLNYGKGVFDLLEIWKEVCKQRPTAKLAIIGDGPREVILQMEKFTRENNFKNNIKNQR